MSRNGESMASGRPSDVWHDSSSSAWAQVAASNAQARIRGFADKTVVESVRAIGLVERDVISLWDLLPSQPFVGLSAKFGVPLIASSAFSIDPRLAALKKWAGGIDAISSSNPVPASSDASFRRYFRFRAGSDSFIVMDAPPANENCRPFVQVAGYLESMGLNAARVIEANLDDGFLLLSDLGSRQYLDELLDDPDSAPRLYGDALSALLTMQRSGVSMQAQLPPYNEAMLRFEMSLFHDWLCGTHLDIPLSEADESEWRSACDLLVANALDQPRVFVHRDYHSRNLMVTAEDNPGILDFQDAVEGPLTYDLVSLLKDCYVKWPSEQVWQWALEFHAGLDAAIQRRVDTAQFRRYFELMGVQRHLKAAGIFCRLNHRDGKPGFLQDIPRTLSYIVELGPRYPELGFLVDLIEQRVLPGLKQS
jgi:aminoglycoside/choline kinase family phosphotransferase